MLFPPNENVRANALNAIWCATSTISRFDDICPELLSVMGRFGLLNKMLGLDIAQIDNTYPEKEMVLCCPIWLPNDQ
jgi:hypothetical protein